jgi:hypothetical protein
LMEGHDADLFHACFDRCLDLDGIAKDRNHTHTLEVCLDFVWGTGCLCCRRGLADGLVPVSGGNGQ